MKTRNEAVAKGNDGLPFFFNHRNLPCVQLRGLANCMFDHPANARITLHQLCYENLTKTETVIYRSTSPWFPPEVVMHTCAIKQYVYRFEVTFAAGRADSVSTGK